MADVKARNLASLKHLAYMSAVRVSELRSNDGSLEPLAAAVDEPVLAPEIATCSRRTVETMVSALAPAWPAAEVKAPT
jgi:hypothetical protein